MKASSDKIAQEDLSRDQYLRLFDQLGMMDYFREYEPYSLPWGCIIFGSDENGPFEIAFSEHPGSYQWEPASRLLTHTKRPIAYGLQIAVQEFEHMVQCAIQQETDFELSLVLECTQYNIDMCKWFLNSVENDFSNIDQNYAIFKNSIHKFRAPDASCFNSQFFSIEDNDTVGIISQCPPVFVSKNFKYISLSEYAQKSNTFGYRPYTDLAEIYKNVDCLWDYCVATLHYISTHRIRLHICKYCGRYFPVPSNAKNIKYCGSICLRHAEDKRKSDKGECEIIETRIKNMLRQRKDDISLSQLEIFMEDNRIFKKKFNRGIESYDSYVNWLTEQHKKYIRQPKNPEKK